MEIEFAVKFNNDKSEHAELIILQIRSMIPPDKYKDVKIENMFNTMIEKYLDDLDSNREDSQIFQWAHGGVRGDYLETTPNGRIVVDYISGMTDDFLNTEYSKMVIPTSFGNKFR